ncbi:MAG: radical SAM protein [Chloroflexi bacterium]|nr:radical SAM protein [Chloroflexota bacterium]
MAPIALDYLAHAVRQAGFQPEVLDLCFSADLEKDIAAFFSGRQPLAVGITLRNTDDTYLASQDFFVPQLKDLVDRIKAHTSAPIVLGGAGLSLMPEAILEYCGVDMGIWGEGEEALPALLQRLACGQDYRDVPALVYRDGAGFRRVPPSYLSLGRISRSPRDAIDNRRYHAEGGMGAVETKRGCNRACIYCADPLSKGRQIRLRSPQSVADEIEALRGQGVDNLHLCDSEFNLPGEHAEAVCLELIKRGQGERVRWYTYASPVPFSDEMAVLFKRAGCAGVNFGVDSAHEGMLRTLRRDFTAEDLARTADICHRQGIVFMYDLLLGGPGETRDSLRQTVEAIKRLSPDRVGAALGVRVVPGTRLAALVRRQGPVASNPNLKGAVEGNDDFFAPVFYLSSELGPDPFSYLESLIGKDERFFVGAKGEAEQNYNYNENTALVKAIREGYRGAFWDILRRMA